jgi:hypothetical protein
MDINTLEQKYSNELHNFRPKAANKTTGYDMFISIVNDIII